MRHGFVTYLGPIKVPPGKGGKVLGVGVGSMVIVVGSGTGAAIGAGRGAEVGDGLGGLVGDGTGGGVGAGVSEPNRGVGGPSKPGQFHSAGGYSVAGQATERIQST